MNEYSFQAESRRVSNLKFANVSHLGIPMRLEDPSDNNKSLFHKSDKEEEANLEDIPSPIVKGKQFIGAYKHDKGSDSHQMNLTDESESELYFFDLSNVDMRIYRSLEYDSLRQSKQKLFRDTWAMFKGSNVVDVFEIAPANFSNFINHAYTEYQRHNNTFHNFKHGVNVMNVSYFFLKEGNLSLYFDSLSVAALMFATLMHDIGHTGRSNKFEQMSRSDLSVTYNDNSILEMHHAALAFKILLVPDNNIFKSMDKDDYFMFRKYVIRGILATDIKFHVSDVEKFQSKIDGTNFKPYVDDLPEQADFLLLFGVLVHCADLYTPTKEHPNCMEWAKLLNAEFLSQVKMEEKLGLPVTPWFVKLGDPVEMAKGEKFFIQKIVRPLWVEVDRFFEGKLAGHISNIDKSYKFWEEIEAGLIQLNQLTIIETGSQDGEDSEEMHANQIEFDHDVENEISQILTKEI